jgi:hypothetical protein
MEAYTAMKEAALPLRGQNGHSLGTLKENKAVYELNIRNYPNDASYVAEQQKKLDENNKEIASLMEAAKKPFQGKEVWEGKFPEDPSLIVKKRLEEYLALVRTVDFEAQLSAPDAYKVRKFVNPAYEKKSMQWKALYRAGKEVNLEVTKFVNDWLKGEVIATVKTKMIPEAEPATDEVATYVSTEATELLPAVVSAGDEQAVPDVPSQTTDAPAPMKKEKKSLIGKLKDKAKAIIKD